MSCLSNAGASRRGSSITPRKLLLTAILALAALFGPRATAPAAAASPAVPHRVMVQNDSDSDESEVPPADVEKYIAVYKAMQRDRSLTAETAAAQNGMTLDAFRQLEARVQRDDAALQRARDELQAAAKKAAPAGSP